MTGLRRRFVIAGVGLGLVAAGAGIGHLVLRPSSALRRPTGLVADGDSITQGYPGPAEESYPAQLARLTGLDVLNVGTGQARLSQRSESFARRGIGSHYAETSCNTLIAGGGINDIRAGVGENALRQSLLAYVKQARASGFQVLVSTLLPAGDSQMRDSRKQATRASYVAWLRASFPGFSDGIVDFAAIPAMQDPSDTRVYVDRLHPTSAGYALMAALAAQVIAG